jgi:hypothetical protein
MTQRYRRVAGVVERDLVDVVLLLARGADAPVSLEGAAAVVWDAAEQGVTVAEITAAIEVDDAEVERLLGELVASGVLVAVP